MNIKVRQFLQNSINNLSSGYLLYSRFQEDAEKTADEFAQMIFCDTHDNCGKCSSCRKFQDNNMISYFSVSPDEKDLIKIDAVRQIQDYLNTQAKDHEYRCIHIKGANKLTVQSQNYLLKTLEEPPRNVVFILSVDNKDMILETVRSRLIEVNIPPSSRKEIIERMTEQGYGYEDALLGASWGRGSYENALKTVDDSRLKEIRDLAEKILMRLATKRNPSMFLLMQDFSEAGEDLSELLYAMDSLLLDSVIYPEEAEKLDNPDKTDCLASLKAGFTLKKLEGIIEVVNERIEQRMNFPQFRQDLMIENMIFDILEVIA